MPAKKIRYGIKVAQMGGTYDEMRDAWLEADKLGFDTGWGHDHLLNQDDHSAPEDEGWVALTALLAQTERIRGGLMTGCHTFRHPSVVAKMATTLDRVSNGRLELGMGAGWMEAEHEQYGVTLPPVGERMKRLEEGIQIMRALWTQHRPTFEGTYYQIKEAWHVPGPVQKPHPPLVIGGGGEKVMLRIVATYADEWNCSKADLDLFKHKMAVLDQHCANVGRDPKAIERSVQFGAPQLDEAESLAAHARQFVEAGATHLIFTCPKPYSAAGARWLWNEVVARLKG
ncbi:MAG: TIGR03560 family F420-dependent LLM class oxidoreductase [Chloroflexota bacterium]